MSPIQQFDELCIETVASCNRTCPTCLRNAYPDRGAVEQRFGRQKRMPEQLFRKIIDDASSMGFAGRVNLQHYNEPFQDPRIGELAVYAREHGEWSLLYMHSNADLLNERRARIVDGVLDRIVISLYDKIGGRPMPADQASARRKEISSWFRDTELEWTNGTHVVTHHSPHLNLEEEIRFSRNRPCTREVQMRMILDWRGEMLLCCEDIEGPWKLGNAQDKSLEQLWHSRKHEKIVKSLAVAGGRDRFAYCRICPRRGTW